MPRISAGVPDGAGNSGGEMLVRLGPTVNVQIGLDPGFHPSNPGVPDLQTEPLLALIDTGAMGISIDGDLADGLNLPIVNRTSVAGVNGIFRTNMYEAQIFLPDLGIVVIGEFAGVHLQAAGQPHLVLLGRSFLQNFTMTYEGRTGIVTLSND